MAFNYPQKTFVDNMVMFLKGLNNMSDRSSIASSPDYSSYTLRGDKALRKALSVREDNCSPSIQDSKPNRSLIKESIKQSLSFLDIRKF